MIAYRKTAGRAHDVRFVSDNYVAQPGETNIDADVLPSVESLSDIPVVNDYRAQAINEARALRAQLFSRFDGLQASALATGNTDQATEIEGVKAALRSMTSDVSLDGLTTLTAMRIAYKTRWNQIRSPLTGALKTAFAAMDS